MAAGPGPPLTEAARRRRRTFDSYAAALANYASKPPMSAFAPSALEAYVRGGLRPVDPADPDGPVELCCSPETEAATFEGGATHDTWDRLGHIAVPTMVLGGALDAPPPRLVEADRRPPAQRPLPAPPRARPLRAVQRTGPPGDPRLRRPHPRNSDFHKQNRAERTISRPRIAAAPGAYDEAMATTTGFNHIATGTPDLDRIKQFYLDAFGAETVFEMAAQPDHPRMAIIELGGGAALNVFEVPEESLIGDRKVQGGRGPIDHYGIAVDSLASLEAVRDRLVELGTDIGEIHQLGTIWSLFFRDPDGMELEVCAPG